MALKVLVIDVGGTNVKLWREGLESPLKLPSGAAMTPSQMVAAVKQSIARWDFDSIALGYPGAVRDGRIVKEPHNLGPGWVDFDFAKALGKPVRIINDAAMQALGAYKGGRMLFLGLGTGLGSTLIIDTVVAPLELGHLPYRKGTYEDYVGRRGLDRLGKSKWRKHVEIIVDLFAAALLPDEIVLGGGQAMKLKDLPPGCRLGSNADSFEGGLRLWAVPPQPATGEPAPARVQGLPRPAKPQAAGLH